MSQFPLPVDPANPWKALLRSRKFWLAVFAMAQAVLFHFLPQFPDEIWQTIAAVVMVLIGGIALEDAGRNVAARPQQVTYNLAPAQPDCDEEPQD